MPFHLEIYNSLKSNCRNDLKDLDIINFELVFKILKELILGDQNLQENFIIQLIEDLATLTSKKVVIFAEQFLVPFLNGNQEIPVCLHPYYYKQKRPAYQGFSYTAQPKEKDSFNSKLLTKTEKDSFQESIKPIANKIFGNKKYQFQLVVEQNLQNKNLANISEKV